MWWEPANGREDALKVDTESLSHWFNRMIEVDERGTLLGVGSVWSPIYRMLVPVIVVHADAAAAGPVWAAADRDMAAATARLPIGIPLPFELLAAEAPVATRLGLHLMAVGPPRPSGLSWDVAQDLLRDVLHEKRPIVCAAAGKVGTAGVMVRYRDSSIGLATAGHVVSPPRPNGDSTRPAVPAATDVAVGTRRWPLLGRFSPVTPFGNVSHVSIPPPGSAGWDVAAIRPEKALDARRSIFTGTFQRFEVPEPAFARGAISGVVRRSTIVGALTDVGSKSFKWRNCWMLGPTGVLGQGDSGTAVFLCRNGALIGIYVGTSHGGATFHYVQDANTMEQQLLRQWGISFA